MSNLSHTTNDEIVFGFEDGNLIEDGFFM